MEERVEDLLARMNLEEKVAQLGCVWSVQLVEDEAFSRSKAAQHLSRGVGQIARIGGATGLRPAESAAFLNSIQRYLLEETRLGIPAIVHEESTAGFTARDADQFPQAIGLASTWDPERVRQAGDAIRRQMLAVGARQTLAPVLDVARDARWGRVEETYGDTLVNLIVLYDLMEDPDRAREVLLQLIEEMPERSEIRRWSKKLMPDRELDEPDSEGDAEESSDKEAEADKESATGNDKESATDKKAEGAAGSE